MHPSHGHVHVTTTYMSHVQCTCDVAHVLSSTLDMNTVQSTTAITIYTVLEYSVIHVPCTAVCTEQLQLLYMTACVFHHVNCV